MAGYGALLIGQQVPYRRRIQIPEPETRRFQSLTQRNRQMALTALTIPQTLAILRNPLYRWPAASSPGVS